MRQAISGVYHQRPSLAACTADSSPRHHQTAPPAPGKRGPPANPLGRTVPHVSACIRSITFWKRIRSLLPVLAVCYQERPGVKGVAREKISPKFLCMNKQLAITADAYRSLKERLEFTHNEMGRLLGVTGRMSKNWSRHGTAPSSAAVLADWIGLHLDGASRGDRAGSGRCPVAKGQGRPGLHQGAEGSARDGPHPRS